MKPLFQRRRFLTMASTGIFGISMADLLRSVCLASSDSTEQGRALILIWLDGAPSTIDMWDPKPNAPDAIRGEFSAIQTSVPGVMFSEHLPKMARMMDRCTLIRSMHHSIPEHGPATQYLLTGHAPSPALIYPSLGSVVAKLSDNEGAIPAYMAFNNPAAGNAGYLGSAWNAFELASGENALAKGLSFDGDQDVDQFAKRLALRDAFDRGLDDLEYDPIASGLRRFQQSAVRTLQEDRLRKALDLSAEPPEIRRRYGERSQLGQDLLRSRRLVEAGSRFVTVGYSGWDTHTNNFAQLRNTLLPQLDAGFAALTTDLQERGLLDSTIVCCGGEFGRTPTVNGRAGRDHWSRAFSVLLAGAGLRPGLVHGATDDSGGDPVQDPCTPPDLFATLLSMIGIDPLGEITSPSGRPMPLVKGGYPIKAILS